jgi:hypothetical protein
VCSTLCCCLNFKILKSHNMFRPNLTIFGC